MIADSFPTMQHASNTLRCLPCVDSPQMAQSRSTELNIPRDIAASLGRTAVEATDIGHYVDSRGNNVDWAQLVERGRSAKKSIAPEDPLPEREVTVHPLTQVQVCNETTLQAARRLVDAGHRPLALNFANGVQPGGGFLHGARAQEEVLCRSSALYSTLVGDRMYTNHRERTLPDSTDWAIYSPDVPVFRTDDGTPLDEPWLLSFITSAAPYAPQIGQPRSAELLRKRIHRVLAIASAYGYETLVLGAWGCGAFENDPHTTAVDFREALENEFRGHFSDVLFAITDWSNDRKYLGPFREVFTSSRAGLQSTAEQAAHHLLREGRELVGARHLADLEVVVARGGLVR